MLNYTFQYGVYNVNNILWDPRININLGTAIVFGHISPQIKKDNIHSIFEFQWHLIQTHDAIQIFNCSRQNRPGS